MRNIVHFIIGGFILLIGQNLSAQRAQVIILDAQTKEPIPYANICFESLHGAQKFYAISSLDGIVDNKAKSPSQIAISYTGYESLFDTIEAEETKTFFLKTDLFQLNQVVVTATRTKKALKDVPVLTQVISSEEIESRGVQDISSILEDDVPGIEFQQAGYGADISMQGLDASYVLVLIDGERMAGETEGNVDYSRINMNDVERVEIVKGASSALYGSEAMGGVINIITKKPRQKVEFSLGARYQEFNQWNYRGLAADDDFYVFKSNLDKPNLNLNASLGINIGKWTSKTTFSRKTTDAYQLTSSKFMEKHIIEYDTVTKGNVQFSYHDDKYEKFDFFEKLDDRKIVYSDHYYNPKVMWNHKLWERHALSFGGEWLKEKLETRMFSGTSESLDDVQAATLTVFVQDDFTLNSKLSMVAGLRLDKHSAYGLHLTPKFALMYKWIPFTFRFNYAAGYRSPTLKELYMNWDHLGIFDIVGDPNLKPETNQYISFSTEFIQKNWNISVSAYKNWFENKISGFWSTNAQGKLSYNYSNSGKSNLSGVELLLKYRLNGTWYVNGGYTYFHNNETTNGVRVSALAPHSGNLGVEYGLRKGFFDMKVNLKAKITGAKNYYEFTTLSIKGKEELVSYEAKYQPFSIWKISVSQKFSKGVHLVVGVDNLFDYKAPIINFNTSLSPGRRFFVSLNVKFDELYRKIRN
ncbi:MAG: TonB-dependent receptor [Bacteroidetes bacterium 4572_77]|nr:MAG: TonB-dependent receptor [Bacteroidetes bacterium 4572_77]